MVATTIQVRFPPMRKLPCLFWTPKRYWVRSSPAAPLLCDIKSGAGSLLPISLLGGQYFSPPPGMDSPSRLLALVLSFVSVMGRDVQIWMLLSGSVFVRRVGFCGESGAICQIEDLLTVQCRCWEQDRLQYVHGSTLVLRGSEGDRCISERLIHCRSIGVVLIVLCRGVMVHMRRVESTLKIQWRDLVGIEGLSRCSSHIVLMVDEFYFVFNGFVLYPSFGSGWYMLPRRLMALEGMYSLSALVYGVGRKRVLYMTADYGYSASQTGSHHYRYCLRR
ncbi:hypothetical protein YC2023_079463 [Brassica napus]